MKKIIMLWLMIALLSAFTYAGVCNVISPTTGTAIRANYQFNLTSTSEYTFNCSGTMSSTLSGDSVSFRLDNRSGSAAEANETNVTTSTLVLEDASDYVLNVKCYNATQQETDACSVSGIIVDNTEPTAPSTITPTTSRDSAGIAISSAVVGANTTACTLTVSSTYSTQTWSMTHSGDVCSTSINLPGSGSYTVTISATDGLNSAETSQLLTVKENGVNYVPQPVTPAAAATTTTAGESTKTRNFVIFLGAVGVIAYLLFNGKKKRR
jgi:hypothetical protein